MNNDVLYTWKRNFVWLSDSHSGGFTFSKQIPGFHLTDYSHVRALKFVDGEKKTPLRESNLHSIILINLCFLEGVCCVCAEQY
jgi:hypothetical protein